MEQESYASESNIPTHNKYSLLQELSDIRETLTTLEMMTPCVKRVRHSWDTEQPRVRRQRGNSPTRTTLETIVEMEEEIDCMADDNVTSDTSNDSEDAEGKKNPEGDEDLLQGNDASDGDPAAHNADEEVDDEVNVISMRTDTLWFVDAVVGGRGWSATGKALVDTGASNNLIAERLVNSRGDVEATHIRSIGGIGPSEVGTVGRVYLSVDLPGIRFQNVEFEVLKDEDMRYGIILGVSLFVSEGLVVDFQGKRLSKHRNDGSRLDVCFNDQTGGAQIMEEDVVVRAAHEAKVTGTAMVQLQLELPPQEGLNGQRMDVMYYEDKGINKKVIGVQGLIQREEPIVMVHLSGNLSQKVHTIRKGDILGKVSMVTKEEDEPESEEPWTEQELRSSDRIDIGGELKQEEREVVVQMLWQHNQALSKGEFDLGQAVVAPHRIELVDDSPIWMKPRKFSEPVNQEIERQCQELLGARVIEHSDSPFSSAIVPVSKRDGGLRMCIDYRRLNDVTKTEQFPMPNLTELVYRAGGVRFFTKLDVTKGYYHVPLEESSRKYTAFSTQQNHYQFTTLSFGLKNSGIAFQRCMQQILAQCCSQDIMCYIDDILITSRDFDGHLRLVGRVLETLSSNGIKVKLSKCEFFKAEVQFLGHRLSRDGIRKDPGYMDSVKTYPKPKTVTELRRFLGLVNFQRKFVRDCSLISKPLTEVTGGAKKQALEWTEEIEGAFEKLKAEMVKEVTLTFPEYGPQAAPLRLFVDASGVGAGACLMQRQDGENRTVAFGSMTFTGTEQRYSTIERELTAVRWGVKLFRPFLMGVVFELWTDHKPLVYLKNMSQDKSKFMRTVDELADYTFTIHYVPGRDNGAADALSRIAQTPETAMLDDEDTWRLPLGFEVRETVPGGGDSLFQAVILGLRRTRIEDVTVEKPTDSQALRERAVDHVIQNKEKYGLKLNRDEARELKAMRRPGRLPSDSIIMAIAVVCQIEIWVHHGRDTVVVYREDEDTAEAGRPRVHLQCISGIHFNPVETDRRKEEMDHLVRADHVNVFRKPGTPVVAVLTEEEMVEPNRPTVGCTHINGAPSRCCLFIGNQQVCALLDTGAQVNLMGQSVYEELREDGGEFEECNWRVTGLGRRHTTVSGIYSTKVHFGGDQEGVIVDFAVVPSDSLPCCCLLGAGFLERNRVLLDFKRNAAYFGGILTSSARVPFLRRLGNQSTTGMWMGNVELVTGVDVCETKIRYVLPSENLSTLQNRDHAIRSLRNKVKRQVHPREWSSRPLDQFKRYWQSFRLENGILTVEFSGRRVPVYPFSEFVGVCYKTHQQVAHVGRPKLLELVSRNFWHPAIHKVIRDVCTTCEICQLYKPTPQRVAPPTIKIQSSGPFDLVALDLLQLPTSSRRNVAVVVAVDHYSKWVAAAALKDKTSRVVCAALESSILPTMLKLPNRILTDNGPEFRSEEFQDFLHRKNIQLVHSTAYKASSNGAVERVNQTLTRIVAGLVNDNPSSWDLRLQEAVRIYNDTLHAQLQRTPSDFLLSVAHTVAPNTSIDANITDTWKAGHPRFAPFKLHEWVAYKIPHIGNTLGKKFAPKYGGPCQVVKVQSNGVTYELRERDSGRIIKKHHQSLKLWHFPPRYLLSLPEAKTSQQIVSMDARELMEDERPLQDRSNVWEDPSLMNGETRDYTAAWKSDESESSENSDTSVGNHHAGVQEPLCIPIGETPRSVSSYSGCSSLSQSEDVEVPRRSNLRRKSQITSGKAVNNRLSSRVSGLARSAEAVPPTVGDLAASNVETLQQKATPDDFTDAGSDHRTTDSLGTQTDSPLPRTKSVSECTECAQREVIGRYLETLEDRNWDDWDVTDSLSPQPGSTGEHRCFQPATCSTPVNVRRGGKPVPGVPVSSSVGSPLAKVWRNFADMLDQVNAFLEPRDKQKSGVAVGNLDDHLVKSSTTSSDAHEPFRAPEGLTSDLGHNPVESPCLLVPMETEFSGFGEDCSTQNDGTSRVLKLQALLRRRRFTKAGGTRRGSVFDAIWTPRAAVLNGSSSRRWSLPDQTIFPGTDLNLPDPPRRPHTRSRGPVADVPLVQGKTLEYKPYRKPMKD